MFCLSMQEYQNMRELKTVNIDHDDEQVNQEEIYNINLFRLNTFSKKKRYRWFQSRGYY